MQYTGAFASDEFHIYAPCLCAIRARHACHGCRTASRPAAVKIPVTETVDGISITDNYRWLEDQNSPQTRAWIAAEQAYTARFFAQLPERRQIVTALSDLERVETRTTPVVANGAYFFSRRLPSEQQASIFVRRGSSGKDDLLVDPNTLAPDHSISVSIADVSRDGQILAYEIRKGGQDETEVHFLRVETKKELPDVLPKARNGLMLGHSFTSDDATLYYGKKPMNGSPHVYRHRFGTPVSSDQDLFGGSYGADYGADCGVTQTEKYLYCEAAKGAAGVERDLYVQKLNGASNLRPIAEHVSGVLATDLYRDEVLILTSAQAPHGKVLAIDFDKPSRENWKEVIPESGTTINGLSVAAGRVFVTALENVSEHCRTYRPDGTFLGEVKLPVAGSIGPVRGEEQGTEAFFQFSSFAHPPEIFRITGDQTVTPWWRSSVPISFDAIDINQVTYSSKDGTKIPMFIVAKKGNEPGSRPTLLTGYGGFDLVQTPRWSPVVAWWVDQGGVFAIPALRGGGEFGEAWHRAGMFENKQNVFDDFIAAAEYLIHSGITSRERLAIYGTSNGGLLVGAALTQRPDLFRAVVCGAPLLDMVRYQKFKIAKLWVPEYGSSDDPKQLRYILAYSPYQHVQPGVTYPAVMFWSGDGDTRVDPLHARKMTAEMQAEAAPKRPIIIRYDTLTGHSGGRSVDQQINFDADFLAFVKSQIG